MQTETVSKITKGNEQPQLESLRAYFWTVAAGWLAMVAAGVVLAPMKKVAAGVAISIIAAVLPYLAYSIPTGCFQSHDFYRLAGLAVCLAFWYLVLPSAVWSDLLFLLGPAAIMISKVLKQIYASPLPHVPLDILGKLMLIHVAALAVLVLRG